MPPPVFLTWSGVYPGRYHASLSLDAVSITAPARRVKLMNCARLTLTCLALTVAAWESRSAARADGPAGSQEEITRFERAWAEAVARHDIDGPRGIQRYLHPEFVFTNPRGLVSDRGHHLDDFRSGVLRFNSVQLADVITHTFGNAAVVVLKASVRGTASGHPADGDYRFTDTLVRTQNGPPGTTGWLAVARQMTQINARPGGSSAQPTAGGDGQTSVSSRRKDQDAAVRRLRSAWRSFFEDRARAPVRDESQQVPPLDESALPLAQRLSFALASTTAFQEPEEIRADPTTRELRVTLVVQKAHNRIGSDPVYLRNYNGKLVGPTLRAHPGDTLRVTLKNDLEPEIDHPGDMNVLHDFNTTNLHTHGLHVSPTGTSDNVLLEIGPSATQDFEIHIPLDHPCGTFWYHAHKHGSVAAQVSSGMSGALIIEKSEGTIDQVPEIVRARERIFVFQQIPYYVPPGGQEGVIELEFADKCFGPGTWDQLGRFTTVNGVQLPVIRLNPGAVERWRLIHSGVRETLLLSVRKVDRATNTLGPPVRLFEFAADGLPTGSLAPNDNIELWPGYRSDCLFQAPATPGDDYLLVDERTGPADSINGVPESRKFVARLVVDGAPASMSLPDPSGLQGFRLPSIRPEEVTGRQTATYGILNNPVRFTIDGHPYDPAQPRVLTRDAVDEWTATSRNEVGPVHHPFHIHVNPFELISVKDDQGREKLTAPVWKDTIILREGWTVRFRTRYRDFEGDFVQHCHILDHEDQGMMQLLRIGSNLTASDGVGTASRGPADSAIKVGAFAPRWALREARGALVRSDDFSGRPSVLIFSQGLGCLHCSEQLRLFLAHIREFEQKGARLVVVCPNAPKEDAGGLERSASLTVVSDAARDVFRSYGCFGARGASHGIYVLTGRGTVAWRRVSESAYLDVADVLKQVDMASRRP